MEEVPISVAPMTHSNSGFRRLFHWCGHFQWCRNKIMRIFDPVFRSKKLSTLKRFISLFGSCTRHFSSTFNSIFHNFFSWANFVSPKLLPFSALRTVSTGIPNEKANHHRIQRYSTSSLSLGDVISRRTGSAKVLSVLGKRYCKRHGLLIYRFSVVPDRLR